MLFYLLIILSLSVSGCSGLFAGTPARLVYRDWEGAMPQGVLDAFTEETGIPVDYQPYDSQEDAVAEMRAGKIFDVLVLENQFLPGLIQEKRLAELTYKNIPNFKNVSANFRDLAYDPHNAHSVPYSWGTTGLVVRSDLVAEPVTSWGALFDARYAGKSVVWTLPRYTIGAALKTLGYSLNTENPEELEAALQLLIRSKPNLRLVDWEMAVSAPYLISGEVLVAVGEADDAIAGRDGHPKITYVMPKEGAIMWGDNWTILANSPNQANAERLINFFLRAEISAQITNETHFWLPNDAARPLVNPGIRDDAAIFPTTETIQDAEILLPLSSAGEALYEQIWQRFLDAK